MPSDQTVGEQVLSSQLLTPAESSRVTRNMSRYLNASMVLRGPWPTRRMAVGKNLKQAQGASLQAMVLAYEPQCGSFSRLAFRDLVTLDRSQQVQVTAGVFP